MQLNFGLLNNISFREIVGAKILYQNKYIFDNKGYLVAANHQSVFDTIFF